MITKEFVQNLVDVFGNFDEEPNILEWELRNGMLWIKIEDMADGAVSIFKINMENMGLAASLDEGNFEIQE